MTTQEIKELFNKISLPLDNTTVIRGITFDAFHAAILKTEHVAFIEGLDQGMDKLMEAVEKGLQTAAL